MTSPFRIDTHHHVVPPKYSSFLKARNVLPGGVAVPKWSPSAAIHLMDSINVQTSILSLSTPGVWFGDDADARSMAREVNEYTADLVRDNSERFGFFATLTLPDVEGAIAEAEYALDVLGADGIILLANAAGTYLGDSSFDPLMEFLNQREAVVFIHPGDLPGGPAAGIPAFTADFLLDTTRAAISLILSGTTKKYPRIRFILAHAGGFVPYISFRILLTMLRAEGKLSQIKAVLNQEREIPKRLEMIQHFYFDIALSSTRAALPSLLEIAKPDHVLFGSDYPFAPAPAAKLMVNEFEKYELTPSQRSAIDFENAQKLFPRLR